MNDLSWADSPFLNGAKTQVWGRGLARPPQAMILRKTKLL